jgi:hypothetical protein
MCAKHAQGYENSASAKRRDEKKRVSRASDEVHNHRMIVRVYRGAMTKK